VDTQVFFWANMKKSPPNDPFAVKRAINLFGYLEENDIRVLLPSVVVAEVLVTIPYADHLSVMSKLQEDWMIANFDLRVASAFARLKRKFLDESGKRELKRITEGSTKAVITADMMVLSTALANGADYLVTDDLHLLKLAAGEIETMRSDSIPFQPNMFDDE